MGYDCYIPILFIYEHIIILLSHLALNNLCNWYMLLNNHYTINVC